MSDKFSRDVVWNVASIGVAGVCGFAVTFTIGIVYDAETVGTFNQVFAVFLIFAQLATAGVHNAMLTYAAPADEPAAQRAIATAGLTLTLAASIAMVAAYLALAGPIGRAVDSPDVARALPWAAPGIACLALNKVALGVLNARRRMRWYASLQAGRMAGMAVALAGCVAVGVRATTLPVILSIGEGGVLVIALIAIRDQLGRVDRAAIAHWVGRHWRFGTRGMLSGLFAELNMRIVVLLLGVFATDAAVGAYSFAALIAEGLYQVLIALRNNYAPIAVRQLARNEHPALLAMFRRARLRVYAIAIVGGAFAVGVYALAVPRLASDPVLADSSIYFAIVIGGLVAGAGYIPFNQLLSWGDRPGLYTIQIALVVAATIGTAAVLVASHGAIGAAIATGATHVWAALVLVILVRRGLRLAI